MTLEEAFIEVRSESTKWSIKYLELKKENEMLKEVLVSMQIDATNDDSINYTQKWIKRARQVLLKLNQEQDS